MRHLLCVIALFAALPAFGNEGYYIHKGAPVAFDYDPGERAEAISLAERKAGDSLAELGFRAVKSRAPGKLQPVTFPSGIKAVMKNRYAVRIADQCATKDVFSTSLPSPTAFNPKLFIVDEPTAIAAMESANKLAEQPCVKYAHPMFHFPIEARSAAAEPLFSQQWHLQNTGQRGGTPGVDLNVTDAWLTTQGSEETIIGLIDLGFEQDHPDLKDAWLINEGEVPGNRRDDDGNGLIDDDRGWNFDIDNNQLIYGSSNSHGTATAGIIAAPANGIGVSGVCPGCKVLPIVIYTDIEDAVAAFYYARDRGARVISNSWGYRIGTPETEMLEEALTDVAINSHNGKGISILFAMPNWGADACLEVNPDISAHPDVLAISSVDFHDRKVSAAGFGPCLKFVGPTAESQINAIVTTDRMGDRGYNRPGVSYPDLSDQNYTQSFYGTSAATPALAGVFGLMYSANPGLTAPEVFAILQNTAIKVSPDDAGYDADGFSEMYGYGRPDAAAAVSASVVKR